MSPQWATPAPQRPITPQPHIISVQQPNVVYPIYPVKKVMLQVQP
jgi:hypothetical protein